MKKKSFALYYFVACFGTFLLSWYPFSMGVRVAADMLRDGVVLKENYPKYIIPYTPICIAVLVSVLLMPLLIKLLRRYALLGGSAVAIGVFFAAELLLEQKVVVNTGELVAPLEQWQMFMCYTPAGGWNTKTLTPVEILMGEYHPAFKLHFYMISVILILSVLNCLYGFGQMVKTGQKKRRTALILQAVCSGVFLGLCILACFTAFWRDGSIRVSPLSAALMILFFVLLGVTVGIFAGSFFLGKGKALAVWLPSALASGVTLLMYVGEMILLNGQLYSFGTGFLFAGIPGIVLAPVDLLVIAAAGCLTGMIFWIMRKKLSNADSQ